MQQTFTSFLSKQNLPEELSTIAEKVFNNERISKEEGLILFEKGSLPFLGSLANFVRERLHGDKTYFNRNFHIEPTNVCIFLQLLFLLPPLCSS